MSNNLIDKALWLRQTCLKMFLKCNQGHPGSVFSQIEMLIYMFYANIINFDNKDRTLRDKLIISKGHATMGLYPILAEYGYFDEKYLYELGSPNSFLKLFGNIEIPGIDATSGSLGHGVGIGCGYAESDKISDNKLKTFVIISEGEMYEGSTWESAMYASHNNLDNLFVIIDRNRKIILGDTEDMLSLEPISQKWESFGFEAVLSDGHDFNSLADGFSKLQSPNGKPKVMIANTIKGKGISFMENIPSWHYWRKLSNEEENIAKKDLFIYE